MSVALQQWIRWRLFVRWQGWRLSAHEEGRCGQRLCDSSRAAHVSSDIGVSSQRTDGTPSWERQSNLLLVARVMVGTDQMSGKVRACLARQVESGLARTVDELFSCRYE